MGAPVFNRGGWISLRFDQADNANWEYISAQVSKPGMLVDRTTAIRLALHAYCAEAEPGALSHMAQLIRAALEWYAARLRAGG